MFLGYINAVLSLYKLFNEKWLDKILTQWNFYFIWLLKKYNAALQMLVVDDVFFVKEVAVVTTRWNTSWK